MTHRLLSPTQDTHTQWLTHMPKQLYTAAVSQSSIVIHRHTHTQTHGASVGIQCRAWTKGTGAACRMWGWTDGDVARGNWYPNTALTPVTPVTYWINGGIDTHGESETTEEGKERRTEKDSVCVCVWLVFAFCTAVYTCLCTFIVFTKMLNLGALYDVCIYVCVLMRWKVEIGKCVCVCLCPTYPLYVFSNLVSMCMWVSRRQMCASEMN